MKYHERLAEMIRARLGGGVDVYADTSIVSLSEVGTNASALAHIPSGDHRKAPTDDDVSDAIATAMGRLRSDIPKYRPEFVEPARAFAARLAAAIEGES
jgi:hypothetical protein